MTPNDALGNTMQKEGRMHVAISEINKQLHK